MSTCQRYAWTIITCVSSRNAARSSLGAWYINNNLKNRWEFADTPQQHLRIEQTSLMKPDARHDKKEFRLAPDSQLQSEFRRNTSVGWRPWIKWRCHDLNNILNEKINIKTHNDTHYNKCRHQLAIAAHMRIPSTRRHPQTYPNHKYCFKPESYDIKAH